MINSGMRNLLDFLAKYSYWLLFVLLEAISFVLLFRFNSYQGSVWFSSANIVAGKIYDTSSKIESYFQLSKINEQLTQRNLYLEQRLAKLERDLGDSAADTAMNRSLLLQSLHPYRLIPAKVVGMSWNRRDNLLTINKGEADGVKKDMGVVCGTGVVGIVYLTSATMPLSFLCSIRNRISAALSKDAVISDTCIGQAATRLKPMLTMYRAMPTSNSMRTLSQAAIPPYFQRV